MIDPRGILVVQHVPWEGPGIIGTILDETSASFETVEMCRGQSIPIERIEQGAFAAVIALGSPANACDPKTNPHHVEEIGLFRLIRRMRIPSFSICYSMQLFCVGHGGSIAPNPRGKEVGFFDVHLTSTGRDDPVFGSVGDFRTLQWHGDAVARLPEGALQLAYSDKTPYQAAVLDGVHYMVQGDGQAASPSMLKSWFDHDGEWAQKGTGVSRDRVIQEVIENHKYFSETYRCIFGNFLKLIVARQGGFQQGAGKG